MIMWIADSLKLRKEQKILRGCLQTKGNNYYAVLTIDGKKKWINLHIENKRGNKRKAEQAMCELVVKYNENPQLFQKNDFCKYIQYWLDKAKNQVDIITYEGYRQCTEKHIIPYFKPLKMTLQEIKIADIEKYYNYKAIGGRLDGKDGGLSYRSIKLHSVVLNLIFKQAMYDNLIVDNPCSYAKIPQAVRKNVRKTEFYTTEQCKNLLSVTQNSPLHNMIYVTVLYGLRRSELLGLKWDAVDLKSKTVTIQHTVVLQNIVAEKDSTKNKTSNRIYPLLPDIQKIFEGLKEQQEYYKKIFGNCYTDSDYIFTKPNGEPYYPSYPTHTLQKILKANSLPHIRWHDLRHSCASILIAIGWHMKDISDWLGHADIGTTMNIYGHLSMERKNELGKTLSGLLS